MAGSRPYEQVFAMLATSYDEALIDEALKFVVPTLSKNAAPLLTLTNAVQKYCDQRRTPLPAGFFQQAKPLPALLPANTPAEVAALRKKVSAVVAKACRQWPKVARAQEADYTRYEATRLRLFPNGIDYGTQVEP